MIVLVAFSFLNAWQHVIPLRPRCYTLKVQSSPSSKTSETDCLELRVGKNHEARTAASCSFGKEVMDPDGSPCTTPTVMP